MKSSMNKTIVLDKYTLFIRLIGICLIWPWFSCQSLGMTIDFTSETDTVLAYLYLEQSDSLLDLNEIDLAIEQIETAKKIFKNQTVWEGYVQSFLELANCYSYKESYRKYEIYLDSADLIAKNKLLVDAPVFWNVYYSRGNFYLETDQTDSALIYLKKAIKIISPETEKEWEDYIWNEISLSITYYYSNELLDMENALDRALKAAEKHLPTTHEIFDFIYSNQAVVYAESGAYNKSLTTGKKALEHRVLTGVETYEDSIQLAISHQNLGVFYSNFGDREQVLKEYLLALSLYHELNVKRITTVELLYNIAKFYANNKDDEKALFYYHQELRILNQKGGKILTRRRARDYVMACSDLANLFLKVENQDSALFYFNAGLVVGEEFDVRLDVLYGVFGRLCLKKREYQKGIFYFKKALNTNVRYFGTKHPRCFPYYRYLAEAQMELGFLEDALKNCQQAIWNGSENFDPDDLFYTPPIEEFNGTIRYAYILSLKSKVLQKMNVKSPKYLDVTYETCKKVMGLMDGLLSSQETEVGKDVLSTHVFPIFENAIQVALKLYKNTKDKTYLYDAFSFAEKSKSLLLLESFKELEKNQLIDDPMLLVLLKEEKEINSQLIFYKRKLFEEKQKGSKKNNLKIKNWEASIIDLNKEAEQVRFNLETEFPDYFHLKYDLSVASVENIQQILNERFDDEKTAFIEYFLGDRTVYVFLISVNDFQIFEIPRDEVFNNEFVNFKNAQNANPANLNDKNSLQHYTNYIQSAYYLCQQLILQIINDNKFNRLLIVPDGQLGFLSFESFISTLPNEEEISYSISNLDYLIKDYSISYAYSGTLFLENLKKRNKKAIKTYAGFAPIFQQNNRPIAAERGCHGEQLGTLENSEKSVRLINEFLGGDIYLNEMANKKSFVEKSSDYRLLHLSTHACVDDHDPMFNKVYFADDYLATYELYNLKLNADLIVLSACETGRGELVRGEGIMSLARGFMQAGCPSVITSLWNANDFSTSDIMIAFHKNLKEGQTKDAALRNAKLAYLEKAPSRLSSPYFWATFVGVGNMEAMELEDDWSVGWLAGLAILFFLCVVLLRLKGIENGRFLIK